jgi:hypothetical protein
MPPPRRLGGLPVLVGHSVALFQFQEPLFGCCPGRFSGLQRRRCDFSGYMYPSCWKARLSAAVCGEEVLWASNLESLQAGGHRAERR